MTENYADVSKCMQGLPIASAKRSIGSMFIINLGMLYITPMPPHYLRRPERLRFTGEWSLLVECCAWEIIREGRSICTWEDNQEFIDRTLDDIVGLRFIAIREANRCLVFSFTGAELRMSSDSEFADDDACTLFRFSDSVTEANDVVRTWSNEQLSEIP